MAVILVQGKPLAECVTLNADPTTPNELPPIVVSGALCGTTSVDGLEPNKLGGLSLNLVDEHDVLVATTHTNSKATFKFSRLPRGIYHLQPPNGFARTKQLIEVTLGAQVACDRPLFVKLQVSGECALSRITTARPPGF